MDYTATQTPSAKTCVHVAHDSVTLDLHTRSRASATEVFGKQPQLPQPSNQRFSRTLLCKHPPETACLHCTRLLADGPVALLLGFTTVESPVKNSRFPRVHAVPEVEIAHPLFQVEGRHTVACPVAQLSQSQLHDSAVPELLICCAADAFLYRFPCQSPCFLVCKRDLPIVARSSSVGPRRILLCVGTVGCDVSTSTSTVTRTICASLPQKRKTFPSHDECVRHNTR